MTDLIPTFGASDGTDPLVKRFAAHLVTIVGNTTPSPHTKRAYERGARDFLDWWMREGCPELSRALVQAYVETLRQAGRPPARSTSAWRRSASWPARRRRTAGWTSSAHAASKA